MQNLPTAEIYEKEFKYMPWGILIKEVEGYISKNAPQNGTVLDMLCGPGYLLGKLQKLRSDLSYHGVDLESEFIDHAKKLYPEISFEIADAFKWNSDKQFDVVLCTAGLHHLPYDQQEPFVEKLSKLVKKDGFAIIGDPYIDDYSNEKERKVAGAKLGYEYLVTTIENGGTDDVIDAAIGVLVNDVTLVEWKSSIKKNKPVFEKYFTHVEMHKTWPKEESEYGDYYFILRN
jgi:2-polyprenyl-3-methyl-5-hydroxy-6-metoxy-1,4-benzoquinol methylase